jgi:hypothetical protein
MALQLFKIASVEVATPQATIDFTSIPSGYTDLIIVCSIRDTINSGASPGQGALRFNGDSANNYSRRYVRGNGSTADSSFASSVSAFIWRVEQPNGATANTFGSTTLYIPNYTSSNYKSISMDNVTENNATEAHAELATGLWNSTSAITSISLLSASSANMMTNSTFTLYGVL